MLWPEGNTQELASTTGTKECPQNYKGNKMNSK
jgi:hypothetical protein